MKTIKAMRSASAEPIASGKVQGVCYRMYTQQKARQLGVRGYVRNLRNGDVESKPVCLMPLNFFGMTPQKIERDD